jgi:hypothetical protein
MIFIGILLHGICYDFFFVTGFIYTEKKAVPSIRGQAQGFLVVVTQGIGLGLGAPIIQRIVDRYKSVEYDKLVGQAEVFREQYRQLADTNPEQAAQAWNDATQLLLSATNWKAVWMYPCLFALAVLIAFIAMFYDHVNGGKKTEDGRLKTEDGRRKTED